MMKTTAINGSEWFPNINTAITHGDIQCFPTVKAANDAAKQFGWNGDVLRVVRRFETVCIVGKIDFQPDCVAGVVVDTLRVPMLRWERRADGTQFQPVLEARKPRKEAPNA